MRLHNESAPWVERETLVEATPEQVWEALAFTWSRPGEGESFVEFTLEPLPAGTRVTVVETPTHSAATSTAAGPAAIASAIWDFRLSRLHRSLRFVPVA